MKLKSNGRYLYLADDNGDPIGIQKGLTITSEVDQITTVTVTFINKIEVDGEIDITTRDVEFELK